MINVFMDPRIDYKLADLKATEGFYKETWKPFLRGI